jgi:hypothetical protein
MLDFDLSKMALIGAVALAVLGPERLATHERPAWMMAIDRALSPKKHRQIRRDAEAGVPYVRLARTARACETAIARRMWVLP